MADSINNNNVCLCCQILNQEKEDVAISEIHIRTVGYYNFHVRIRHCPECGKKLKKYECGESQYER